MLNSDDFLQSKGNGNEVEIVVIFRPIALKKDASSWRDIEEVEDGIVERHGDNSVSNATANIALDS